VRADPVVINPLPTNETLLASTPAGLAIYHYVNSFPFIGWFWQVIDQSSGLPDSYVNDAAVQFIGGKRHTWIATSSRLVRWDGSAVQDYDGTCNLDTAERLFVDAS